MAILAHCNAGSEDADTAFLCYMNAGTHPKKIGEGKVVLLVSIFKYRN
jgi:hypothetical protein